MGRAGRTCDLGIKSPPRTFGGSPPDAPSLEQLSFVSRRKPDAVSKEDSAGARSSRFFFGGALGGRDCFQTLIWNRHAALDRNAVCSGRKARLGTLEGSELFAQVVCKPFVELVLVQIGREIHRVLIVRFLARVQMTEPRQRSLDSPSLGGQQLAGSLGVHLTRRYQRSRDSVATLRATPRPPLWRWRCPEVRACRERERRCGSGRSAVSRMGRSRPSGGRVTNPRGGLPTVDKHGSDVHETWS